MVIRGGGRYIILWGHLSRFVTLVTLLATRGAKTTTPAGDPGVVVVVGWGGARWGGAGWVGGGVLNLRTAFPKGTLVAEKQRKP